MKTYRAEAFRESADWFVATVREIQHCRHGIVNHIVWQMGGFVSESDALTAARDVVLEQFS